MSTFRVWSLILSREGMENAWKEDHNFTLSDKRGVKTEGLL